MDAARRRLRVTLLVAAALLAFAGNSILCRAALAAGGTDAATFTLVRIVSGAIVLVALAAKTSAGRSSLLAARHGAGVRSVALFAYAALFSFAYRRLPAGIGALVLFACVQLTMIAAAIRGHAGPVGWQWAGVGLALLGLAVLTLNGAASRPAPDAIGVAMMAASGVAWGVYTLRGRRSAAPLATTATSFLGAVPLALVAAAAAAIGGGLVANAEGLLLAIASGAITSGLGYAIWYAALPSIATTTAAVVQLAAPVIAALLAIALLHEPPTLRLAVSSAAILGGIALATLVRPRRATAAPEADAAPARG